MNPIFSGKIRYFCFPTILTINAYDDVILLYVFVSNWVIKSLFCLKGI